MAQKNDQPPASPTLIPALPSPIPPTTSSAATSEELSFFDRAKKSISNKNTFNEFLKLCNLFSQDLVDRTVLVHRARSFIGTNPELMKWFQEFVGYDEKDVIVENKARIPGGRVSLSNCRGLGPSYRLLPKRVCCLFLSFFSLSPVLFFWIMLEYVRLGLERLKPATAMGCWMWEVIAYEQQPSSPTQPQSSTGKLQQPWSLPAESFGGRLHQPRLLPGFTSRRHPLRFLLSPLLLSWEAGTGPTFGLGAVRSSLSLLATDRLHTTLDHVFWISHQYYLAFNLFNNTAGP
jgi:hypothetical protein